MNWRNIGKAPIGQAKFDRGRTVGCRLPLEEYLAFKAVAESLGMTVSALMRELAKQAVNDAARG
jgi:predicted DNA-binding protein